MRRTRTLRLTALAIMAVVLLTVSLDLLISRSGDGDSGRVAVFFVSDERMFPQTDFRLLCSSEDIEAVFVIENDLDTEEMSQQVDQALERHDATSVVVLCEGDYAVEGLQIASEDNRVSDLVLLSPKVSKQSELNEFGAERPACRVAIFSAQTAISDTLYERLSGEDTKYTSGTQADESAPELYLSSDARQYYARMNHWSNSVVSQERLLNSPVMQTYLANYFHNYVLEKDGVSRAPLGYWVLKTVCTTLTVVAFFLYAATLPQNKKLSVSNQPNDMGTGSEDTYARPTKGKPKGRPLSEKYQSALNHLMALQGVIGIAAGIVACIFVAKGEAAFHTVFLVWICFSLLSSAFYLLRFLRRIKDQKVRKNRSMWQIHLAFTSLLILDIFVLKLFWKGNGFLRLNLLLLVGILLSVMVFIATTMLQLTDEYYGKNQGTKQSVMDSIMFSAIRFVPMVIVFVFSVIIGKEVYALRTILLLLALIGASYLRRVIRKGGMGELFSVILYACLYWMMF